MRDNSGSGKSKNNLHDVTLKEHEAKRGVSGEAELGGKRPGKRQTDEGGPADKG
jgi:hypothetical protein